ncbi:MAG TPA: polymer-forming cytoskeletal protein [Burkholderiaceae bacterium]|nr:polymer-forming cytoskeletal protein [Burkholderiaceae bacterium]
MFAKRPPKRPSVDVKQLSSLIAEDVEITGDVCFSGGIRIDGRIRGNVTVRAGDSGGRALLVLSEKGRIEGSVCCADAVINGDVVGDLEIAHFLELQSSARVTGAIRYHQLQMDVGATVRGQLLQADAMALGTDTNVVELGADKAAARASA